MAEPLQVIADEVHFYADTDVFYPFNISNSNEFKILHVWGWVNRTGQEYGPTRHVFVRDLDYEVFNDGIRWIGNDIPVAPPSYMGVSRTPFYVSYVFKRDMSKRIRSYLYPFIKEGATTGWVDGIARQADRILAEGQRLQQMRSIIKSDGTELDLLANWFNRERIAGESDLSFRSRNIDFEFYLSSGTKIAIMDIVEAFTGTRPEIAELWLTTSYWNYNPDDPSMVYYWASRDHPELNQEPLFRWWDFTHQISTFYVILDVNVINAYGIVPLKLLINTLKAAGVEGYLGYLVDETFSGGHDDNWEPQVDVKGETSDPLDWAVNGTSLNYVYTSTSSHPSGMSVVDDTHHIGSNDWDDYVVTAYCTNTSSVDSNNIMVGLVTRWNETTDEFYFFGMCTNNNTCYIYKYEGGTPSWQLIDSGTTDVEGNALVFDKGTSYHFRVVMSKSGAKLYIDNDLIYESTADFDEIVSGRPGFAAITSSTAIIGEFDDITVVV
jgi:hypothetical protein